MLFTVRGQKEGFLQALVEFLAFVANNANLFPSVCGQVLSGGALIPLHKLTESEQISREEVELPPKLRPINSGSLFAKCALSAVLATPAAKQASESTSPYQLSLGVSRGPEKLIHTCRAAHEMKWLIGKNDY